MFAGTCKLQVHTTRSRATFPPRERIRLPLEIQIIHTVDYQRDYETFVAFFPLLCLVRKRDIWEFCGCRASHVAPMFDLRTREGKWWFMVMDTWAFAVKFYKQTSIFKRNIEIKFYNTVCVYLMIRLNSIRLTLYSDVGIFFFFFYKNPVFG